MLTLALLCPIPWLVGNVTSIPLPTTNTKYKTEDWM